MREDLLKIAGAVIGLVALLLLVAIAYLAILAMIYATRWAV